MSTSSLKALPTVTKAAQHPMCACGQPAVFTLHANTACAMTRCAVCAAFYLSGYMDADIVVYTNDGGK
jgi:hypothetical protein